MRSSGRNDHNVNFAGSLAHPECAGAELEKDAAGVKAGAPRRIYFAADSSRAMVPAACFMVVISACNLSVSGSLIFGIETLIAASTGPSCEGIGTAKQQPP